MKSHPRASRPAAAAIAALSLTAAALAAPAETPPPAVQVLQKQGVTVIGPFASKTGLKAWAATAGGRPVALYVTPGGAVIAGSALDADGAPLEDAALEAAVRKPLTDADWKLLEASRWIADGKDRAPRVVYVFTDPNCPFCAKLWFDARPWVDSGKVQLRHVMVGLLAPTSAGKAAALLTAENPREALRAYESALAPAAARSLAAGEAPRPLAGTALQPLANIPPAVAAQLEAHARLMARLGLVATPGVVWRDAKGVIQQRTGVPEPALAEVLGPR